MQVNTWTKCYESGWKDIIVPESFQHPAKMSYSLLKRILSHAKAEGWLNKGDVILDPFGGIGSTGILGAYEKIKVISVELERDFVILAARNYLLHCKKGWCTCGNNGNDYLQLLQKTISKKSERLQHQQKEQDEESILFDRLSGEMGQRQEIEQTTQDKAEGENTLEQRQALVERNESQVVETGKQWQSSDGEKRALEGRKIHQNGRICSNTSERQAEDGARSHNGTAFGAENDQRRDCSSQERQPPRQSNRESTGNDNRRASKIPQHRRQKSQTQKETCPTCGKFIVPYPIILQGDSRQLCQIVEKADCIMGSPPFQGSMQSGCPESKWDLIQKCIRDGKGHASKKLAPSVGIDYGQTPGQLGAMKPGNVDMVVSSPPYANCPVESSIQSRAGNPETDITKAAQNAGYGVSKGNLGNLKSGDVDCVISSPPFEEQQVGGGIAAAQQDESKYPIANNLRSMGSKNQGYQAQGQAKGQLGQDKGDTFWQAAKLIVEQCHQILKPSGHAIWVVKSFVRKKKIVDFPGDWQRLCESVGFKTVCIHHAMLVKETIYKTLFGHTEVNRKERKSFFRRLAESKGSPRIDNEVVLCMETSLS